MTTDTSRPIRTVPGPIYWYYTTNDDGPIYGRSDTKAEAVEAWLTECGEELRQELEAEGEFPSSITDEVLRSMCPGVAMYRRPSIGTGVFDADMIMEQMEDCNESAVWPEQPPNLKPEIKRMLERHLAEALYEFCERHGIWDEFRGMEWMGDTE